MKCVKIDLEKPQENSALQALVSSTVVPGAISYVYDRMGDYRRFAQAQGQGFDVWALWSEQSELLGTTQITFNRAYWKGKPETLSYFGDVRVAPSARGRGLSDLLIQTVCSQPMPVLGAVMGSNSLVLEKKLKDWQKVGVDFKIIGELNALMYRAARVSAPGKVKARTAKKSDLPKMFQVWNEVQSKRNLGRFYADLNEFQKVYEATSGVSLDSTWIVEDEFQNCVGFLSLWDQSSIRQIKVHQLSLGARVFAALARPWIRVPSEGEELKVAYAFQYCLKPESNAKNALMALIAAARSRAKERGFLLFSLGMDARDPLLPTAAKGALTSNSVKIIAANEQADDRLLHLEVGLG